MGTNGEASLLDDDEADLVLETARQEVPADRTLIAGVGRESTRATVAAARRAAAGGADAVLVRAPSFYRAHVPIPALVSHYTAVSDASPVPVLLYNYAAFTGVNTDARPSDGWPRIPTSPAETSTDGAQFVELAAAVPAHGSACSRDRRPAHSSVLPAPRSHPGFVAGVRPELCLPLRALALEGRHAGETLAVNAGCRTRASSRPGSGSRG
jgi:hypothetical protein